MSGRPSGSSTNTARRDPDAGRHVVDPLAIAGGRAGAAGGVAAAVAEGEVVEDHHRQAAAAVAAPDVGLHRHLNLREPVPHPGRRRLAGNLVHRNSVLGTGAPPLVGGAAGIRFGVEHPVGVLERVLPLHAWRAHAGVRLARGAGGGERRRSGRDHAGHERKTRAEDDDDGGQASHGCWISRRRRQQTPEGQPLHDDREEDHHIGHRQQDRRGRDLRADRERERDRQAAAQPPR